MIPLNTNIPDREDCPIPKRSRLADSITLLKELKELFESSRREAGNNSKRGRE
jgi:hypothetical protein